MNLKLPRPPATINISIREKDKIRRNDIVAIVVTHNRKELLLKCVQSLLAQTIPTDILIVDNASTDGTEKKLESFGLFDSQKIHYLFLNRNTGGAGGFHHGLKYAFDKGWSWFWMMDDDADPQKMALEELLQQNPNKNNIYGSVAVDNLENEDKLCFPIKRTSASKTELVENYRDLAPEERVAWLPFLGFFINRCVVEKIGFPDKTLFIRNDDIEYAEKAKIQGIKIILIKASVIKHPLQPTIPFSLLGRQLYYRSMPPWKTYYEVRNKIIIAKRYYPLLGGIESLSGATLQLFISIMIEKEKKAYLKAYFQGALDGIKTP